MLLPCKHDASAVDQVEPAIDLLRHLDGQHPDVLKAHGLEPADYHSKLVFRSAIESIRGTYIASSLTQRQGLVADVLETMKQNDLIEDSMLESKQLSLFEESDHVELDARLWGGSFNAKESSLHQLAPYVGKLKSGMVRVLIDLYSRPGDVVFDPFCGSGVVPLECVLLGRHAIANDLSPYAYVITRGKLSAPDSKHDALLEAEDVIREVELRKSSIDPEIAPDWVRRFFHPETFKEVRAAFQVLKERQNYFLMACLLGILHHVRPGFLSYPASHLTPYLRPKMYPPEKFPHMYSYRDLKSRLLAKVERAYRRSMFTHLRDQPTWTVLQENTMNLSIPSASVNTVISSPPYFGALDYARDNRLRLWFLGVPDWKQLDRSLTASDQVYVPQMTQCLKELDRVLRDGGYCVLVLGDVERNGSKKHTANIVCELAREVSNGRMITKFIYVDEIPDIRRSRRRTRTTKCEQILVMQKIE
ncbi:MAG: DNA adenine methylase [Chloroflexi bacterium]|nr:DNA adenine methylase [Chloroflexota bacterium]